MIIFDHVGILLMMAFWIIFCLASLYCFYRMLCKKPPKNIPVSPVPPGKDPS